MNGAQDLGGMMGLGPVAPEQDEPIFHADWERHALAVTLACGALGEWSIDESRFVRESIPPARYLAMSYYEIWSDALVRLLDSRGLVSREELVEGRALARARTTRRPAPGADAMRAILARGGPCDRPVSAPARFAVGDRVRTLVMHPAGHTRLPRYARGKVGVVERIHGSFVFPDTNAHGQGENPTWVYTVRFDGRELWGRDADPTLSVSTDCWEPYLEPAGAAP